jgi:hypothetical protein
VSGRGGNAPRWRGEAGFFEIWFVVAFDLVVPRAWWFRYTTFAPRVGPPRGTIWAAAFAAGRAPVWGKNVVPIDAVHAAVAALDRGVCEGAVVAGEHRIAWLLRMDVTACAGSRGPGWLERVPAPTHVAHVLGEAGVEGTVRVDDDEHVVRKAQGAQKHLWGTRRVEELFWVYSPRLDDGGAFEATQVRVRSRARASVAPVWLRSGGRAWGWWSVPALLGNRVEPEDVGHLRVRAISTRARVDAVATCDPRTLAGYVYRDPSGFDVHVAQSDVARCEVELRTRAHPLAAWSVPRRLVGEQAAVEFHRLEPLPNVRYVPWDGATAPSSA